jgi:quinoprotein glucose dehydrogenase
MWGLTLFDQLWCRIKFRQARYDGTLTPVGLDRPTVVYPLLVSCERPAAPAPVVG